MSAPRATFTIDARDCVFTVQNLSAPHLYPTAADATEDGPIVVSRLNVPHLYFVHNGRHRVIRALLHGTTQLEAVSLYDNDGTTTAATTP